MLFSRLICLIVCILLGTIGSAQTLTQDQCYIASELELKGFGYVPGYQRAWPEGIVPYFFDVPNETERRRITETMEEAIEQMNATTNVCWVPALDPTNGVRIIKSNETYSYARLGYSRGADHAGLLALGYFNKSTALHEMGHVLGLQHEHMRPDRDDYIKVYEENIESDFLYAFAKLPPSQLRNYQTATPYDIHSIMHYGGYGFSRNRRPTITDLAGNTTDLGGDELTPSDIDQINSTYTGISRSSCDSLYRARTFDVRISSTTTTSTSQSPCLNRETTLLADAVGPQAKDLFLT